MAKVVRLKTKDVYSNLPSVEECRRLFKLEEYGYTDDELLQMRDFLFKLAKIYYDFYMTDFRHRAKVIKLNNEPNGTEESHHLRKGKYRRAS